MDLLGFLRSFCFGGVNEIGRRIDGLVDLWIVGMRTGFTRSGGSATGDHARPPRESAVRVDRFLFGLVLRKGAPALRDFMAAFYYGGLDNYGLTVMAKRSTEPEHEILLCSSLTPWNEPSTAGAAS